MVVFDDGQIMVKKNIKLRLVKGSLNTSSEKSDVPESISCEEEKDEFVEYLFRRYKAPLRRYLHNLRCSNEETEEILQETYIRIIKTSNLDRLEVRARGYLYKIALNLLRDRIRRGNVRQKNNHVQIDGLEIESVAPSPEQIAEWNGNLGLIKQVLLSLQPRCRKVFLLHFFEQYSLKDISGILKVHRKTVERDLALAIDLCRSAVGEQNE